MKSISTTIWILAILLVVATLDNVPDPPAVNPTAVCKVLQVHDYSGDAATRLADSLSAPDTLSVSFVSADLSDPYRPSDRIILSGQAADSSPPVSLP